MHGTAAPAQLLRGSPLGRWIPIPGMGILTPGRPGPTYQGLRRRRPDDPERTSMQFATKSRTITITGMTGDDSVQRVRASLNDISGVTTETVTLGQATVACAYPASFDLACAAISAAGFKTSEPGAPPATLGTPLGTSTGRAPGVAFPPAPPRPPPALAEPLAVAEPSPAVPVTV